MFTLIFLEAEDISSNDNKDIFGSTQPMLLVKHEAKLFAISPGISRDGQHNANHVKMEPNIDGGEGMIHISRYSVFLRVQNMKVYVNLPLKLWLGVRDG